MKKKVLFILSILIITYFADMGVKTVNARWDSAQNYNLAIKYIKEKKYPQAIGLLREIKNYKHANDLIEQLQYVIDGSYIGNGHWAVGAITSNGGVQVAFNGENNPYSSVNSWKNINSISFRGGDSIEGLTTEGTIVTTSTSTIEELLESRVTSANAMSEVVKAVSGWNNIKFFQAIYPHSAVAIDKDGSVYAAYPSYADGTVKLNGWENIVAIADGGCYVVGLKDDGTVILNDYDYSGKLDTSEWKDIVAISAGSSLIALKEDGTVVATGLNRFGEGNVSEWNDIIAISTYHSYTLGLKEDGTVVAAGQSPFGAMDITEWSNIVAIQAGSYFSIGLKTDGTMVISGDSSYSGSNTPDVSDMKYLYVPKVTLHD